jgi:hypothetical protein
MNVSLLLDVAQNMSLKLHGNSIDRSKQHVIDVGANLGSYTLPALAAGANVVSLEPYPPNAGRLELSLRLSGARNGFLMDGIDRTVSGNISSLGARGSSSSGGGGNGPFYYMFNNAVSDVSGQRVGLLSNFMKTESIINAGSQTILPLDEAEEGGFEAGHQVLQVATVTLDEVAERVGLLTRDRETGRLPLLSMLKLDCEGCEPLALRGASRLFAENPPLVVLTEVFPARLAVSGVGYREYLHSIEQMGYNLFTLEVEYISPALTSNHPFYDNMGRNYIRDVYGVRADLYK